MFVPNTLHAKYPRQESEHGKLVSLGSGFIVVEYIVGVPETVKVLYDSETEVIVDKEWEGGWDTFVDLETHGNHVTKMVIH